VFIIIIVKTKSKTIFLFSIHSIDRVCKMATKRDDELKPFVEENGRRTIVIQPCSRHLRVGYAQHSKPMANILHCIARRRTQQQDSQVERDSPDNQVVRDNLESQVERDNLEKDELESNAFERLREIANEMVNCVVDDSSSSSGSDGSNDSESTMTARNSRDRCVSLARVQIDDDDLDDDVDDDDILFGERALRVAKRYPDQFVLSWPIVHGYLNVVGGAQTVQSIRADLAALWRSVLDRYLHVRGGADVFRLCRVMLIVPDQFQRRDVKPMVDVLLRDLAFGSVFLHQASVCASFGAGIACACIVDIGATMTSVACVEDGVSLRNTRVTLQYGGDDLDKLVASALRVDDVRVARAVKENLCHLVAGDRDERTLRCALGNADDDDDDSEEAVHVVDAATQRLAPLALLHIDALRPLAAYNGAEPFYEDAADKFDNHYLAQMKAASAAKSQREASETKWAALVSWTRASYRPDIGLADAIVASIGHVGKTELVKRLFAHILLVGGSSRFPGLREAIEHSVTKALPEWADIERVQVMRTHANRAPPDLIAWRGGAIMCSFDVAVWIGRDDWLRRQVVALREQVPFSWRPHTTHVTPNRFASLPFDDGLVSAEAVAKAEARGVQVPASRGRRRGRRPQSSSSTGSAAASSSDRKRKRNRN
jgi:actin-related protein 8